MTEDLLKRLPSKLYYRRPSLQRGFSTTAWFWAFSLVAAPLLYIIVVSFLSRGSYGGIEWRLSLSNYERVFDQTFFIIFVRSIGLAFLNTAICVLIAFPLALFIVFKTGKYKSLFFFLLILPFWTNFLIRTYAWVVLLSDNGWINHALHAIGLVNVEINWLFTLQAVVLGMVYNYLPYMVMSLYVSLEKLDIMLLEAAGDLGAGPWRRFFKVILPLSVPGLAAGCIMVFIPSLGEYVIPDILGGGQTVYVGNLLGSQFLTLRNWPLGSALSVFLVISIMVFLKFFQHWTEDEDDQEMLA